MIEVDQYQRIRYLHTVEGLSQRTIAHQLGISRNTVAKYCDGAILPESTTRTRSNTIMNNTVLEAIRGFLKEDEDALAVGAKKQQHTAKRIYDRLKATEDLGFKGSYESVARVVQQLRKKPSEVFIPLAWEPGEAVQADWGEAVIFIQGQRVKAHMFCTRLCYSAMPFVVVYPGECNEFFLDGHRLSFEFYQGAPHRMIYDNLRTAVQKGWGRYVTQKQPSLRLLEAHYAYVSEFCNPSSGNEKGLVEGLVGWARRNILTPIPRVDSWDEVNDLLRQRCMQYQEHWIEGHRSTVGVEYETERRFLLPLPVKPLDTFRTQTSLVHDDSLIRVDNNQYSAPSQLVGHLVTVQAHAFRIEIWHQGAEVAQHVRNFGRGEISYQLSHYLEPLERKPRAVMQAKPVRANVHAQILEFRGFLSPGADGDREFIKILSLLVQYGERPVLAAIQHCMNTSAHSWEAVRYSLMQDLQTVAEVAASHELDNMGPAVTSSNLEQYDALLEGGQQNEHPQ